MEGRLDKNGPTDATYIGNFRLITKNAIPYSWKLIFLYFVDHDPENSVGQYERSKPSP